MTEHSNVLSMRYLNVKSRVLDIIYRPYRESQSLLMLI